MDISSPLVLLTATDGSTVKLQLKSTGTATYSVGGSIWLPISHDRVISGGTISGGEYIFTGGITSVNGTVYLDKDELVSIINSATSTDKLLATKLGISAGDGVTIVDGKISVKRGEFVAESDFEDRVTKLLPENVEYVAGAGIAIVGNTITSTVKAIEYTAGNGISIVAGEIAVKANEYVKEDGFEARVKSLLPEGAKYTAGTGIELTDNQISVIDGKYVEEDSFVTRVKELIPESAMYVSGDGIYISGTTISVDKDVPRLTDGKLSKDILPDDLDTDTKYTAGDGISIVGNTITSTVKAIEYAAGKGIAITDNVISIVPGTDAGDVPAVDISGKLPASVIPQILEAGNGIVISGTTISAVTAGGEGISYVAGAGLEIIGNTIRAKVFEDLR